jgi:hypothetical protein
MVEKRISKIRGDRHWLWKGGKDRRGYRQEVEKVACSECGSRVNLCIHHLDLDHYNDAPENLQVLCVSHHLSLHKAAYWAAYRNGDTTPKSNCPSGWERNHVEGGDTDV